MNHKISLLIGSPNLAQEWHPTKNGNLLPDNVGCHSKKKVWWKCIKNNNHEWQAVISDRFRGGGCHYCTNQKVCESNCLATTHPNLIALWHPTKNGSLTPYNVFAGSDKKVWWKCYNGKWPDGSIADDHEWLSAINDISRKICCFCPLCSKASKTVVPSICLATTHPDLIKEWHPTKNETLTPYNVLAGSTKKVWWKCYKGKWPDGSFADDHEWEAGINNRASKGTECPCCNKKKAVLSNCLVITHPELVKEWHPTKNNVTPYDVTFGSRKRIWWTCKDCQYQWNSKLSTRTRKLTADCPACNESKGEKQIHNYLYEKGMQFATQFMFNKESGIHRYKFDFRVFSHKSCVIEFHGGQHYYPVNFGSKKKNSKAETFINTIKRDTKKEAWCKKYNVPLLIIPYWDKDNIPIILEDYFAGKEPKFSEPPEIVKKFVEKRQQIVQSVLNTLAQTGI